MRLGRHTLTRRRAGQKPSGYGTKQVLDWDNPLPDVDFKYCSVQTQPGSEDTDAQDSTITIKQAWIPGHPDVTAVDRVLHDGLLYEIDGPPEHLGFSPGGHTTMILRRSQDELPTV